MYGVHFIAFSRARLWWTEAIKICDHKHQHTNTINVRVNHKLCWPTENCLIIINFPVDSTTPGPVHMYKCVHSHTATMHTIKCHRVFCFRLRSTAALDTFERLCSSRTHAQRLFLIARRSWTWTYRSGVASGPYSWRNTFCSARAFRAACFSELVFIRISVGLVWSVYCDDFWQYFMRLDMELCYSRDRVRWKDLYQARNLLNSEKAGAIWSLTFSLCSTRVKFSLALLMVRSCFAIGRSLPFPMSTLDCDWYKHFYRPTYRPITDKWQQSKVNTH